MLRISDLLGCRVVDEQGKSWGTVRDVRVEQDGPVLSSNLAAFRLHGLAVGTRALAARLGLHHGPPTFVPWGAVVAVEPNVVRIDSAQVVEDESRER